MKLPETIRAAFVITSPAAPATASASATTVVSSRRPSASRVPRRSTTAGMPATPIATSTTPSRQARPNVSLITTPSRSRPSRAASSLSCPFKVSESCARATQLKVKQMPTALR